MQNLLSRRSGPAALVLTALAAIVIGCGGGGGGGGNGSNGNADGSTDGTTNGTVTNGGSAGTDGGSGALPVDSVFYAQAPQGASTYDIKYIKADGTGPGTYATGVSNDNSAAVANPAVAGQIVFARNAGGTTPYGIYRNTSATLVGATTIVAPTYSFVGSLQISRDGTKVVYIGRIGNGLDRVYSVDTANANAITDIDEAFSASLSSAGDRVVYNKFLGADNDTDLFVRVLGAASSVRLTSNTIDDEDPQFSKDGTTVVFSQQTSDSRMRLASIDLATGTVTTLDPVPALTAQRAPSLNGAGDRVAFIGQSNNDASESGLYVADFPSGANATQVVSSADLRLATYWSTLQGRSLGHDSLRLSLPRKR